MDTSEMDTDTFKNFNAFHNAAVNLNLTYLLHYLERDGIDIDLADESGNTALHMVFQKYPDLVTELSIVNILKLLLDHGANPNATNNKGNTPLHLAIKHRLHIAMNLLIERGADLNVQDLDGDSTAHFLIDSEFDNFCATCWSPDYSSQNQERAMKETIDLITLLQSKGLDFNYRNNNGITPAHLAAQLKFQNVLFEVLKYTDNSHICCVNKNNKNILHSLIESLSQTQYIGLKGCPKQSIPFDTEKDFFTSIIDLLLEKGVSVDVFDNNGKTPIHLVAKLKMLELLDLMLNKVSNVNSRDSDGNTLLHFIIVNDWEISYTSKLDTYVKRFLSKGADLELKDKNGLTPLQVAVSKHYDSIIKLFKNHRANFNVSNDHGNLLHYLMTGKSKGLNKLKCRRMINVLVSQGCDINATNSKGATPFHFALRSGNPWFVERLCELGADVLIRELHPYNFTTLHLAVYYCNFDPKLIKMLMTAGIHVNVRDSHGRSPLHLVASSSDTLSFLLRRGAYVDTSDYDGCLPLHRALKSKNVESVNILIQYGADINDPIIYDLLDNWEPKYERTRHNILKVIMTQWMKLKVAGLPAMNEFENFLHPYNKHEYIGAIAYMDWKGISQAFDLEVMELKSNLIVDKLSWYGFLHMSMSRRCAFLRQNKLKIKIADTLFPHYCEIISAVHRQTLMRIPLLKAAIDAWYKITNFVLPDICMEMIFSKLTNENLRSVIECADQCCQ